MKLLIKIKSFNEFFLGFNGGSAFPGPVGLGGNISPFPYTSYYPFRANNVFAEKREPKANSLARQVATSASMDPAVGMAAALTSSNGATSSLSGDKMSTVLRMDQIGA